VSVDPFWWKTIQKTMTIRKMTIRAMIRRLSGTASRASCCRLMLLGGASTDVAATEEAGVTTFRWSA
jgi:hypothetical protein